MFIKEKISENLIVQAAKNVIYSLGNDNFSNFSQKVENFYTEIEIEDIKSDLSINSSLHRFLNFVLETIIKENLEFLNMNKLSQAIEGGDNFIIKIGQDSDSIEIDRRLFQDWLKENGTDILEADIHDYYSGEASADDTYSLNNKKVTASLKILIRDDIFMKRFEEYTNYQVENFEEYE